MAEVRDRTQQGLRFTVLRGTVGAEVDGESVAVGGPQQRRLLAALLADHDTIVSADRLVEAIWPPDAAPTGARKTVMTYLGRLRTAIGGDHLVTRDAGYELVLDGAGYDATEFELAMAEARASEPDDAVDAYDRALALWSGRAFGDDADEWWLRPVAARLEELHLVAFEERAERLLETGRQAEAVADLERLVAEQPLRERFLELLMRALYLSGRQAEALRAYRRFHDYLADETGLVPSDDLAELEHRIMLGDASLVPASEMAVPGYELDEVIGEGAFGAVYRATQPSVGREVAVKVVRAELADDPRFVQRFEAEAQLVARLEHPHVVPLYDFWRRPGAAFLVFRLLRGGSLEDRIRQGPVSLPIATRLVDEMTAALGAAHDLGIVHRDVKPANVLFDEAGNSYLVDFGIAVVDGLDDDLAMRSAGSPLYASPEQARDGTAGPASDQYALAVVVWEALTGRAPFAGTSTTQVLQAKYVAPVPALGADDGVPPAINDVLQRATAPHAGDRYPTIAEFALAWQIAVAGASTEALRTTGNLADGAPSRAAQPTLARLPTTAVNPFKGLRAFREADASDFHGRGALIERLIVTIDEDQLVTVVGPSGSGKSSLVHAGVVPVLRRRGALVATMVPGTDPMAELESALRRVATTDDAAAIAARLRTPGGLAALATDLVEPGSELVLVVDQFEELWTLVGSVTTRDRFAELLAHAADAPGRLRIITTLRADLYDRPLSHATLGPVVSRSTFAVTPMTPAELADAIEGPVAPTGVRFESGLLATMVGELAEHQGALPLLQFTLTELYERRTNGTITAKAYDEVGGIGGALARRAEQVYLDLDPTISDDARRLFAQLVVPGDGTDDLRRRATFEELQGIDRQVIDRYRENRLLVTDHHPITREPTIEVAHEALLREWPRLREWIDAERDTIRQRRTLTNAAGEWDMLGRDESGLLRGARLEAADELAATQALTGVERDLVAGSRALADRERAETEERLAQKARQNRRLRRLVVAAGILLVLSLAAGLVALNQRGQARDAATAADQNAAAADRAAKRSELARLVSDAERYAPTKPDLSLLLAAEAARRSPDARTANALVTALLSDPDLVRYEGDTNRPRSTDTIKTPGDFPAFSPDSTALAVPDPPGHAIRIVDVLSGQERRRFPIPPMDADAFVVQTSWPRADLILVRGEHTIVGLDPATGTVRLATKSLPGAISDAAISGDASRLAVVSTPAPDRAVVTVISLADGRENSHDIACCVQQTVVGNAQLAATLAGSVAWRGDDLYVASGTGTLERWDPVSATPVEKVTLDLPWVFRIGFSADGSRLYVDGVPPNPKPEAAPSLLQAYDTSTWLPIWPQAQRYLGSFVDDPRHGRVYVADAFNGGNVVSLDRSTGLPAGRAYTMPTGPGCVPYLSPDARFLASGSCSKAALGIWSLDGDGSIMRRAAPLPAQPEQSALTIHPSGNRATIAVSKNGPFDVDLRSGALTPIAGMYAAFYDTNGRLYLVRDDARPGLSRQPVDVPSQPFAVDWGSTPVTVGTASVWDIDAAHGFVATTTDQRTIDIYQGPEKIMSFTADAGILSLGLSADDKRLFVQTVVDLEVVDLADPTKRTKTSVPAGRITLSADRRLLVASELDGTISFWNADTMEKVGDSIPGGPAFPYMELSADSKTLALTDGKKKQVLLYDVDARTQLGVGLPVDVAWDWVAMTGDSRSAYIARSGSIVELSLDRQAWLDAACRAAGRNLTKAEWEAHIGGTPATTCPQWPAPA